MPPSDADAPESRRGGRRPLVLHLDAALEALIDDKRRELRGAGADGPAPTREDVVRLALAVYFGLDDDDPAFDGCRNRPRVQRVARKTPASRRGGGD